MTLSHSIYPRELSIHWRMLVWRDALCYPLFTHFWGQDSRTAALVCKNEINQLFIHNGKTICRTHWENREDRHHLQEFLGVRYRTVNWFQEKQWIKDIEKENIPEKYSFKKKRYQSCLLQEFSCVLQPGLKPRLQLFLRKHGRTIRSWMRFPTGTAP